MVAQRVVWRACGVALLALAAGGAAARTVHVAGTQALAQAIAAARAGDDIVLDDGVYDVPHRILASAAGTAAAPITVRAVHRFKAEIRSSGVIAFQVEGPHWMFRDLYVHGVCADDTTCEHAFHVVGAAKDFRLIGNKLADFNAHLKVNADTARVLPDDGLVEGNEVFDTHSRATTNPVAPINIDNAAGWVVRGNLIYDFGKAQGSGVSYGAFVKGGAASPVMERNLVICSRFHAPVGEMVGLSFGAGNMDPKLCVPHWGDGAACDPEVTGGIMRNNIVVSCSDDGIYLNKSRDTQLLFNTLVGTNGIEFRYEGSTGVVRGNLMDSTARGRDGGHFADGGNLSGVAGLADRYRNARTGDLRLRFTPPGVARGGADAQVPADFCGRPRAAPLDMGALQSSLGDCATLPP
jgi:parallel beta-helix repeat protein